MTFAAIVTLAVGHAAMLIPTSRNSMDSVLAEFAGGKTISTPCTCASTAVGVSRGKPCDMGQARESGGGGQPCLWWSQGCSIGCDFCLTDPKHPANNGTIPTQAITGMPPHADKAGFRVSYCELPSTKATLPKEYWTMNMHAEPFSTDDSYQFNPWRAPGSAPVIDPCGQAGGKYKQTPLGGDSVFGTVNVSGLQLAMGDLGSKVLPPTDPSKVETWKVGSTPRVAWGMRYNHGGGYQYRLCPLEKMPCSEAEFQKMPLDFVRDAHAVMWNNGTLLPIKGMFVDSSVATVVPKGSTWARNPIPRIHTDNIGMAFQGTCGDTGWNKPYKNNVSTKADCQQFPSPCADIDKDWYRDGQNRVGYQPIHEGRCSGDWTLGMISDKVVIPETIAPGRYVVSWRWDAEETAQIWQNCADVNIVA